MNDAATQSLTAPTSNRVQWLRGGSSPEAHRVTFEVSTNGGASYALLGNATRINGGWERTGLTLPIVGQIRARARTVGGSHNSSSSFFETVAPFGYQPEVALVGNGLNIDDGDNTPSAADDTDFGDVDVTGGTLVRTFTITNSGNTNLTLGSVTVGGTHAADFVISAQPAATVATNGSTTFQVTFDPSAIGLRSATLSFTNNDLGENPFNFSIQGTGLAPEIAVAGNSVNIADGDSSPSVTDFSDLGGVAVAGGSLARTFFITNSGNANLTLDTVTVSGAHAANFVVIAQPAATIAPNGITYFQVIFDPSAIGLRSATLSFTNSDANENPFNFNIQGTGLGAEIAVNGNGVNITDGDSTPGAADHTDFDSVNITGSTLVRTFTITNNGNVALTLGSVTLGGTHVADFVVSAQPGGTVGTNGSTTFQITFDPSASGLRNATLSFTNDDPDENPFNFSIRGIGVTPEIAVTGNSLDIADGDSTPSITDQTDFGGVATASGSIVRTFTITNSGSSDLTLGSVTVGGAPDFIVNVQPAASVAPNGSTTFQITFDPGALGLRTAILSFTNNDSDENPFNFSIQGTGGSPEIDVVGNSVNIVDGDVSPSVADHTDFGSVAAASGTIVRTFTITNSGTSSLTLGSVIVGGTHAADFVVSTQPAATVVTNGSTTFQITFDPSASGLRSATLSFADNDSDENPFSFSIQGTGTAIPEIAVSGNSLTISDGDSTPSATDHTDFGGVATAGGTIVRTFTITNSGTASLELGTVTVGGTHAADFIVNVPPVASVAANGSATFQVTFDPSAIGLRSATLSFTNNDSDENPFNYSIQGTGTAPEIAVAGNSVNITDGDSMPSPADHTDFGSVSMASGTIVRTFTITNSGTASLTLGSAGVSGPHSVDFTVTAQPAATVPPNGSTTFQVTFDPSGIGLRNAAILSLSNNDTDENPFNFNLQGTGLGSEIAVIGNGVNITDGDPAPSATDHTDFGSVAAASGTIVRTFTITNSGNIDLALSSVTVGGAQAVEFTVTAQPAAIVVPNGATTFQITFDPGASGLRNATLSFSNNDDNENPFNFSIQGTGSAPEIAVSGNSVDIIDGDYGPDITDHTDFGSVATASGTIIRTFTITNSGATSLVLGGVTVGGTHAADFSVTTQPAATVPTNSATTFQITFNPSAFSLRTATLSITNNDADETPFDFGIQGVGTNTPPNVANAIPDQVATEDVPFSFTIAANTFADVDAGSVLTYSAANVPAWLTFTPATRTFSGTPTNGNVGFVDITVNSTDNGTPALSVGDVFRITVTNVNDAPTVANAIPDQSATEGVLFTFTFATNTFVDVDAGSVLSYSVIGVPAWLTFTPATRTFSGTPTNVTVGFVDITVFATDNVTPPASVNDTFRINFSNVNDPPTINSISDAALNEDATLQTVSLTGISAGGGETQTLTVTATSDNTNVIPHPTIIYSSPNVSGSLRYTPVANASGIARITVTVNDGGASNNITTRNFTVTVNDVNDAPTLSVNGPPPVLEDPGLQTVNLTGISAGGGETQALTITAISGNTNLIPHPTVTYTSPNTNGSLSYTPVTNAYGGALITVTIDDGGLSNNITTRTFTVFVDGQNDAPAATNLAAPETYIEDTPLNLIDIVVSDVDSGVTMTLQLSPQNAGSLSTATSGSVTSTFNPGAGIWFASGPVSNINALLADVIFTPATNYNLPFSLVANAASDNGGFPTSGVKQMTGVPVDDPPTLAAIGDLIIDEDGGLQNVSLTGISAGGGESQTLTVTVTSGNTNVIPNPVISYSSPNPAGALRFTPTTNASGTALITVTINDGQGSNNIVTQTFQVVVNPVNDAPTVTNAIPDRGATQGVPFSFTFGTNTFADVDAGNVFTYSAAGVPAWLTFTPATRTFSGTPTDAGVGFVDIAVTAADNGVPSPGSVSDTFRVTVTNVNDLPAFTKGADQSHPYGTTNTQTFVGWATGITDGDASVTQALTFNVTYSNPGLFATPPSVAADGTLTYTPNGSNGTATVSVSLTDDATAGGPALTSALQTFAITVSDPSVVVPPVIDPQSLKILGNGSLQFSFTNMNDLPFSVLAATNISLPRSNWTVLGVATNIGGGRHAFTDPQATNFPNRLYHLRFP